AETANAEDAARRSRRGTFVFECGAGLWTVLVDERGHGRVAIVLRGIRRDTEAGDLLELRAPLFFLFRFVRHRISGPPAPPRSCGACCRARRSRTARTRRR